MRFATLRALLAAAKLYRAQMIFRVMGPSNASQDDLGDIERLGAVRI
jgi:hypothetical protein